MPIHAQDHCTLPWVLPGWACVLLVLVTACQSGERWSEPTTYLAGSEWRPVDLDGFPVPEDSGAFIAFKAGEQFLGNSGCNSLTGDYQEHDVALTFGPVAATRMMCPDEAMLVEIELLEVLEETRAFWREGTNLTVMDTDGRVLGNFVQTDWD